MYKVPWVDRMEKLVGPYHAFVLELLNCINKLSPLERPIKIKDKELEEKLDTDLEIVIKELEILKINRECSDDFFKVVKQTALKEHIRNLKYEEYDLLKKYRTITNKYEMILSNLHLDKTLYSKNIKQAFVYLYENLLSGKFFNEAIKSEGEIAVNEFKKFLTLENNLSIYPRNLVVACTACNDRIKRDNMNLPIAHPYYTEAANFFNFRLVNEEIIIEFKDGITLIDKKKVKNFLDLFHIRERFNQSHIKKLNDLYRRIRQGIFEELKNKKVELLEVEKTIKYKIEKEKKELSEYKRKAPLTKLKLDYLNQINTILEIKELAGYILLDIELY
ncbi:hypothetical protein P7D02_26195, partial [Bacillus paranthracis]